MLFLNVFKFIFSKNYFRLKIMLNYNTTQNIFQCFKAKSFKSIQIETKNTFFEVMCVKNMFGLSFKQNNELEFNRCRTDIYI